MKTLPILRAAQRVDSRTVRLFFNDGKVMDVRIELRSPVRLTCDGNGLRVAPGVRGEVAAWLLYHMRGRVLAKPVLHNVDQRTPAECEAKHRARLRRKGGRRGQAA